MQSTPVSERRKTTLQSLSKIPGVTGLYRHENGSYYAKKKIQGVKKVAALTTPDGKNIFSRRIAEDALGLWAQDLETPERLDGKKTLGVWFSKLMELWGGMAPATVDKVEYARRNFELDYEAQRPKGIKLLDTPLNAIKPSDLTAFFARRRNKLGCHALNGMSRIVKNVFEVAVGDGAISVNPYAKVPRTIRRKKIVSAPARVPTVEQCQAICDDIRSQRHSANAETSADMLEFIHRAALGLAESVSADWSKVNWDADFIEVRRQKTGAYFKVPLFPQLKPFMIALHERQGRPPAGPLFSILSPKQALYNGCRRLGYESYSPIDFRKARITWMLRKGIPAETIAGWQGHSDNGVLIRKTYSWVISEADKAFEDAQLAKLAEPSTRPSAGKRKRPRKE